MNALLTKLKEHPLNKTVLDFLKIDFSNEKLYFRPWDKVSNALDEGGAALFDDYGKNIPESCKYSISIHNIMFNPDTGEIFAFHTGRYSLFSKCDFKRMGLVNSDDYRKGYTFDCISDITELGKDWVFLDKFEDMEQRLLQQAHQMTIKDYIQRS